MRPPRSFVVVLALLIFCLAAMMSSALAQDEELEPAFVPGQVIVSFAPGTTDAQIDEYYDRYNLTEMDDLNPAATVDGAALTRLAFVPADVSPELVASLERDPIVRYVEPNYIMQVSKEPDDADYSKQWSLNNTGQTGGVADADVDAPEGWDVTTGSPNALVVIIDTGIDYTHEDLIPNLWFNPGECSGTTCEANGTDDDNNGYIDDFHGINAITDTGDPMDDYGHGTHVAGTIGASGNNKLGVVGMNWNIKIVACKFLGASGGGSVAGAVKCFNYAHDLKTKKNLNVVATNNSWGGSAPSDALEEAMAGDDQPLHVCAAGNGNSGAPHYPAAFELDNIVSVASTDHSDMYSEFSNYGDWVDLAAPGSDILSTVPTGNCAICDPSGYAVISGTSMATPHVTGAAELIAAKYPNLTPVQIKQRLLTGVDPLSDTSKNTATNGRLNLLNTLEEDEDAPAAPADLAVTKVLMTQVQLSWTATGDDGTSGNANLYDVRYATTPINPDNWATATPATGEPKPGAPGASEQFAVSGLAADTTYYFALKVLDNVGNESDLSNVVISKTSAGSIVYEDDMESGEGEWTITGNNSLWHLSELRANSPTHAWYYGDDSKKNYDTGGTTNGMLTSPVVELSSNDDVLLVFHEWSQLEASQGYDRTRVQVSVDGTTWETVFESHGTNDQWERRAVDLTPYVEDSETVQVRFWFDSIDNRFNTFEGWYVDDVSIVVAMPSAPGSGPELPNLVMQETNIGFSPADPVQGDEVTVYAVVVNNGTTEAGDVKVQFMDATGDSPVPIGLPQTITSIPVGGSGTAQITYDTTGMVDARTIQVVVDPLNLIAELNEADNQAEQALNLTAELAPNLVILSDNIGFSPATPVLGDPVTVRAVVLNDGGVEAKSVVVQFVDATNSGSSLPVGAPQVIESLAPGQSASLEVIYDTSGKSGDRKLEVVVDPQKAIAESDEEDNEAQATLRMATSPSPNLKIAATDIGFEPAAPQNGEVVSVSATIFNAGVVPAANVMVQFVDSTGGGDSPMGEPLVIASIPPGGSAVASSSFTAYGGGDMKIRVEVDPFNYIGESSEYDNEATATLGALPPPLPNLVVLAENIGFEPDSPVLGGVTTIRAAILNNGGEPATSVVVQFLDTTGGTITPISTPQTLESIAPGGSAVASVVYTTPVEAGSRSVQVVVDPNNFVKEINEEDNAATRSLSVTASAAPNVGISTGNILFSTPAPAEGAAVTITAVIVNNGASAAQRVLVQFVDVTNGAFEPIGSEQMLESIAPGQTANANVVFDTSGRSGNRKIQVLVDSNNLVAESDEGDNEATTNLNVSLPPAANLTVLASSIGFNPLQPVAGQVVSVTVSVLNQGDAGAENVVVQVLDVTGGDTVPVGEPQQIDEIAAGSTGTVRIFYTVGAQAGERQLRVVVDPGNFVAESDETDNRTTVTLSVAAGNMPNLVVQAENIGFQPSSPVNGTPVTLTATILNKGSALAAEVLVQFVDVTDGGAEPIGAKQTLAIIEAGASAQAQVVYDTAGKRGERRIRVVVDPHAVIVESSEMDNEAVARISVAAASLPNLVASEQNIGFSNANPNYGDEVIVSATVLNSGAAPADYVTVQFVDATGDSDTPISASEVISRIEPGASGVVSVRYNTQGRPGERKIQIVIDPNNLVPEADENDNRAVGTLTVQGTALPNLALKSDAIGFDPAELGGEATVAIYATVRNNGGAAAGDVRVQFLDITDGGSTPVDEPQVIPFIAAGSSGLVQVTYNVPSGAVVARKIQVVVDANNAIVEADESDNSSTSTLEVTKAAMPNLTALTGNIGFSEPNPVEGASVTIQAVIRNSGEKDVAEVMVQFADATDSTPVPIGPQQVIPGIAAGGSATVQVVYDTTGKSGDRTIQVTVDPNNFVQESSESDNTAKRDLSLVQASKPNLVVLAGNIGFSPPFPTDSEPTTVRAVVLNHGAVEARDVVVQFLDVTDGTATPIQTPQTIARIPAGTGVSVQVTYATGGKQGERTIQVVADPNNFIAELDEADNKAGKQVTISPPAAANLVALSSNLTFDPAKPQDGALVTVVATVLNNGAAPATDVVVRIEDVTGSPALLIGTPRLVDSVLPGETTTVQVTYDTTGKTGDRKIQLTLDPNNTVAETDETDNVAVATLKVEPPPAPNLVMNADNIKFSPASPTEGTPVTITATILNDGLLKSGKLEVQFFDATNGGTPTPIGTAQTIPDIAPGASETVQVAYDTTGKVGDRTIQVVVDPNNLVTETDETDNEADATLTVTPPSEEPPPDMQANLVITTTAISFVPPAPQPGDPVSITVAVSNTGEAAASSVVIRFLDVTTGSVQIGSDQTIPSLAAGAGTTVTVSFDTTGKSGAQMIKVVADPDNAITESNEDDNEATASLPVGDSTAEQTPRPNLLVLSDGVEVSKSADGSLTVAALVYNRGDADVRGVPVSILDLTSGEPVPLGELQLDYVPARGSERAEALVELPADVSVDAVRIVVDMDDAIREINESDNFADREVAAP